MNLIKFLSKTVKFSVLCMSITCCSMLFSTILFAQSNDLQISDQRTIDSQNKLLETAEEQILEELNSEKNAVAKNLKGTNTSLHIDNIPPLPNEYSNEIEVVQKQVTKPISQKKKLKTTDQSSNTAYQKKIDDLRNALQATRNKLMIADAEVSRLSQILESEHSKTLPTSSNKYNSANSLNSSIPDTDMSDDKVSDDMPIITVVVDKANLRSGPGRNNSPLMTVAKGTRLAVESRLGDWYRIISPTGTRAWVSSEVIRFGKNSKSSPSRTVKIQGVESKSTAEADAFKAMRKAFSGS